MTASRDAHLAIQRQRLDLKLDLEDRRAEGALKVERMRIDFQREEALCQQQEREAQRAHELAMMDRQIQLEHLRHGSEPVIDPSLL